MPLAGAEQSPAVEYCPALSVSSVPWSDLVRAGAAAAAQASRETPPGARRARGSCRRRRWTCWWARGCAGSSSAARSRRQTCRSRAGTWARREYTAASISRNPSFAPTFSVSSFFLQLLLLCYSLLIIFLIRHQIIWSIGLFGGSVSQCSVLPLLDRSSFLSIPS